MPEQQTINISQNFNEIINLLSHSNFYYVVTIGMDGKYSYVNLHYTSTFNYIDNQLIGKAYYLTMHPDDKLVCEEVSNKCFQNPDRSFPATIRKHDGKGGYNITQWEYRAIFDDDNQPAGIFCLGYDITEYVITNQQLEVARTEIAQKRVFYSKLAGSNRT